MESRVVPNADMNAGLLVDTKTKWSPSLKTPKHLGYKEVAYV